MPLPGRADDAEEAGSDEACDELGDEPLAAEEVVGVDGLEAREPLERADAFGGHTSGRGRAGEGVRLLAGDLQVDHLAGELRLDVAQVAPAGSSAGGDVDQPAARLVDRDRERGASELPAGRVAPLRLLRQSPGDHRVERRRQLRPLFVERRGFRLEVREDDRQLRVAPKRRLPDEALVEHAAERVDVRPAVDVVPGDLLGREIVDRAEQVAVVRDLGVGDPLRDAEVGQVDVVGAVRASAGVEQHVGRLHVAMDEAARVRGIERARHLRDDAQSRPSASRRPRWRRSFRSGPST